MFCALVLLTTQGLELPLISLEDRVEVLELSQQQEPSWEFECEDPDMMWAVDGAGHGAQC